MTEEPSSLAGFDGLTQPLVRSDLARRGRGASLAEIASAYAECAPRLRRVAAGILGDADLAQDVVQEAFARAIRKRAGFARTGPVEAWLWRVVVNTALNRRRLEAAEKMTGRRLRSSQSVAENGSADDAPVRSLVAALPDRQRAALFLHYYADLDYATIGGILGIRSGTVGKLLHDARSAIREELDR
jgi:RNA polymerase sigma-70 factor, ECF subfamily